MDANDTRSTRNILIKRSAALGDVLLASAIIPALRKKYPGCSIDFVTDTPEVLQVIPHLRSILPSCEDRSRYDLVVDLDLAYENRPSVSILQAYADRAGVPREDLGVSIQLSSKTIENARKLLKSMVSAPERTLIALQTGTSFWTRNLPVSTFNFIVQHLIAQHDVAFIQLGSMGDPVLEGTVDLRGTTDIATSFAVIAHCQGFIGLDSFLLHAAHALQVPWAAFFGPTDPALRIVPGPEDLLFVSPQPCRFCHHRQKPPAFISVCEKADLVSRTFDAFFQQCIRWRFRHANRLSRQALFWMHRISAHRALRFPTAACMKRFSPEQSAEKIAFWIRNTCRKNNGNQC